MKEPTFRQALVQAWIAVWHNKVLWIFGLLSVFLGQLGFSDVFGKVWSLSELGTSEKAWILLPKFNLNFSGDIWNLLGIILVGGIGVSVVVLIIFLGTTSQGALIANAAEWFKSGNHQRAAKSWRYGLLHFWNILWVNVFRKIALVLLMAAFGLVLKYFLDSRAVGSSFFFAVSLVFLLIASLFFSILSIYALCYVVVEGRGLANAVKKSWSLFVRHVLVSLEVGVVLLFLNFVLMAAIAVGVFVAFLPATLIWLIAGATNIVALAAVGFVLGLFLWLVFLGFIAGIFNAYTTSAWTYLFMSMHTEGITSRVVRFFRHWFGK